MDQEVKERCTHPLILGHGGSMGKSPLKSHLIPVAAATPTATTTTTTTTSTSTCTSSTGTDNIPLKFAEEFGVFANQPDLESDNSSGFTELAGEMGWFSDVGSTMMDRVPRGLMPTSQ